jgi:hypothetical protein
MMDDADRAAMIADGRMDQILGEMLTTMLGDRGWLLIYQGNGAVTGLLATMSREDTIEILRGQADALEGQREIRLRGHGTWEPRLQ